MQTESEAQWPVKTADQIAQGERDYRASILAEPRAEWWELCPDAE